MEEPRHTTTVHRLNGIEAVVCETCGEVEWRSEGDPVDPWEAIEQVLGDFVVLQVLGGLANSTVFVCRPGGRRHSPSFLRPGQWLEMAPGLLASTDGRHLLLSSNDRLLTANLAARIERP